MCRLRENVLKEKNILSFHCSALVSSSPHSVALADPVTTDAGWMLTFCQVKRELSIGDVSCKPRSSRSVLELSPVTSREAVPWPVSMFFKKVQQVESTQKVQGVEC